MQKPTSFTILQFSLFLFLLFHIKLAVSNEETSSLVQCLLQKSNDTASMTKIIYTPDKSSYFTVLYKFDQNLRFETPQTPKPVLILTPYSYSHVQAAILCSNQTGVVMRIRSGGHDFEGSSYVANVPFFVLDTYGFKWISVYAPGKTAWIGAGASVGELYDAISKTDSTLAFPAGYWPPICTGGHISGGGYGPLVRKYGLAADNVIDALVMDVKGNVLDRKGMGEEFFWAIRGGGGASFGIILAYKLSLVSVPETVTAFKVVKTVENGATLLVYKWQQIAHTLPKEITLSLQFTNIVADESGKQTIQVTFFALFLGKTNDLLSLITLNFPELNVTEKDCTTLSWLQYLQYHLNLPIVNTSSFLLSRTGPVSFPYYKAKSDFVQQPIPLKGLQKLWDFTTLVPPGSMTMEWTPLGGRNDEISESSIPFPHREGNSFLVFKSILWNTSDLTVSQQRIDWMKNFHKIMGYYVAKKPRRAYANYRDYDLGVTNPLGKTTISRAGKWGSPYFMSNFDRLVNVKTMVDPGNFFNHEQSIPLAKRRG